MDYVELKGHVLGRENKQKDVYRVRKSLVRRFHKWIGGGSSKGKVMVSAFISAPVEEVIFVFDNDKLAQKALDDFTKATFG